MNEILLNVLVAAGVATLRSTAGYVAVATKETFDAYKFLQGVLVGVVGGGIAGALASDWKLAIIGALGADDIRSVAINTIKK